MPENTTLRQRVKNLAENIADQVHHGECFYDKEELDNFVSDLEKMALLARAYFNENQHEN